MHNNYILAMYFKNNLNSGESAKSFVHFNLKALYILIKKDYVLGFAKFNLQKIQYVKLLK